MRTSFNFGAMATIGAVAVMVPLSAWSQAIVRPPLKKRVEFGRIEAPDQFPLPGGAKIDFRFIINAQFPYVAKDHGSFYFANINSGIIQSTSADPVSQKIQSQYLPEELFKGILASADIPECVVDLPMAVIQGDMLGFEFVNEVGVKFGYAPNETFRPGGSVDVNVRQVQLDMGVKGLDPVSKEWIASAEVNAKQTKTSVNFRATFNSLFVEPRFVFETPIGEVTSKAMVKALDDLNADLDAKEPWTTYVQNVRVSPSGTYVSIRGGVELGIKAGDQFTISNPSYVWKGQPCQSTGFRQGALPAGIGEARLNFVGRGMSELLLTQETDVIPKRGALVRIHKLV
ncbi:MAG: hypothetical protein K2X47_15465, partial [Bdellovibrionales bacterium]|nr:hypothetical protein [Bdellovibrionales bacterium]